MKKQLQQSQPPYPDPPESLSEKSKSLWNELGPAHAQSLARQILLAQALICLDRCEECRAAIAAEGLTSITKTTGALHVHPLLKVEFEARRQFSNLWFDRLCMTIAPSI